MARASCLARLAPGRERLWVLTLALPPLFSRSAAAMPSSELWAVDLFGRVFTLSTAGRHWELCRDAQLEFKRVSAAAPCCWGIACDNQVYVHVGASGVPIRCREEAYENQVGSRAAGLLGWSLCREVRAPAPQAPGLFPPSPPSFC